MSQNYDHICFRKNWSISDDLWYLMGKCASLTEAICATPLPPKERATLHSLSLKKGAISTTAIEGNTLTEIEVDRIMAGEELPESKGYQEQEVKNILEAMNDVLERIAIGDSELPDLSPHLLLRFHKQIGKDLGDLFDAIPGRFRDDARVVGSYRCPDHSQIEQMVERLFEWLMGEFDGPTKDAPFCHVILRAILTHLYIEYIHPFGDGNGRAGRLAEFYILSQGGLPSIASHVLSNHYNDTRPQYYRQLDVCRLKNDFTDFIEYSIQGFWDGLHEVFQEVEKIQFKYAWRSHVYSKFGKIPMTSAKVFSRRRRIALDLPIGTWTSERELAEDLEDLVGLRTIRRDLEFLETHELILRSDRKLRTNDLPLQFTAPIRIEGAVF